VFKENPGVEVTRDLEESELTLERAGAERRRAMEQTAKGRAVRKSHGSTGVPNSYAEIRARNRKCFDPRKGTTPRETGSGGKRACSLIETCRWKGAQGIRP